MTPGVLALDVDGVLTDGGIYVSEGGEEMLRFSVLDGFGIRRWIDAGGLCVWISARSSTAMGARAERLGVPHVLLGVVDKSAALEDFLAGYGHSWQDVVYIGDDLVDLEPVRKAGFGVAVASAVAPLKSAAAYVTTAAGGHGAVREVVDRILDSAMECDHEAAQEAQKSDGGQGRPVAGRGGPPSA